MISIEISQTSSVFHSIKFPSENYGKVVGYAALIKYYQLPVPLPKRISLTSAKNRTIVTDSYSLYPKSYFPGEKLKDHLTFALKYEGVNLLVLRKLFLAVDEQDITRIVSDSKGIYIRRIWYLYEWLLDKQIEVENASKRINYKLLADPKIQFTRTNPKSLVKSERHRITNNLLGNKDFCPHVYKSDTIKAFQKKEFQLEQNQFSPQFRPLLSRVSASLMLKDSKSSFALEGEKPKSKKLNGWARAIGTSGKNPLSKEELEKLQQIVLPSNTKIRFGYREEGGFIGDFDRETNEPIPEHISAKWSDLNLLMRGVIDANEKLINDDLDAVVSAAIVSFGFVFIHPFYDGNGRIHRYLIHHILTRKKFTPEGIIFPVSAAIENNKLEYLRALESYSQAILDFIEWETTQTKNVRVLNDTLDYYRYFDATVQVEYLYKCIEETIEVIMPYEIDIMIKLDKFKVEIEDEIGLPDNKIKLLANLLSQNGGQLSKSKREKHFDNISDEEQLHIETAFSEIYSLD